MNQQIIFTSASQGLDARESGFCAVGSSPGMPKSLADNLKRLSGYKHCFAPGDLRNPTLHMASSIRQGGQVLQVLSQISDAGLDYLGRPNKVAHHIVLAGHAPLPPCGPAELLLTTDWMRSTWDTAPEILPPAELPDSIEPRENCMGWYEQTGDAGWAGFLACSAVEPKRKKAVLIYRQTASPLELFAESLALLDPSDRWKVPFTTFGHRVDPKSVLRWLAAPDGTDIAAQYRNNPRLDVLELTGSFHPAEESEWTDRARRGKIQPQSTQQSTT